MTRWLDDVMYSSDDGALKRCRTMHRELPPKAQQRQLLLSTLIVGMACLPVWVRAADSSASHSSKPAGVVMMIGGMINTDESNLSSRTQQLVAPVRHASPMEVASDSPVIIEGGRPLRDLSITSSTSAASRVMALSPMIDEIARTADMDSALLMAVIDVESGGNPQAVSPKGATGLMQLMPDTGARHGAQNLFDPRQNIAAGARYLRQLMLQFGDLQLALAAYNAGEGAVQKYGGQMPPYAETMSYVPRVMRRYLHYRNAVGSLSGAVSDPEADVAQGRVLIVR